MTPWVTRLLVLNVGMYFLTGVFPLLRLWLGYIPALSLSRPWTVLTYMFVHAGLMHLLFNMLALFFFGPQLEARLGGRRFVTLYLVSGFTGALLSLYTPQALIVGASGAVYGVMLGFARYWPRVQILIWGIIPVQARVLVIVMTLLALYGGAGLGQRGVAHLAHLGGFLGGYLYLKLVETRSPAARFRAHARPTPPAAAPADLERWSGIDRGALHPVNREELERVLSKVERSGAGALTPDERAFLERLSRA
jgi:membrane associated rhomboid family serine protease